MLKRLKELRASKGISQQKLANLLGVSQQAINKYENHDVEPDIATLIAIADYFETTIDDLVGRQPPVPCLCEDDLSAAESDLIRLCRRLSPAQQDCVHSVAAHIYSTKE